MLSLLNLLAPGGSHGKLSVLIYHRVHAAADPMRPGDSHASEFDWQMKLISRVFNVLPLSEATQQLRECRLPPRSLSITFDDGYADNHDVAVKILRQYGLTATFFVTSGYLDGGLMWNDAVIEAMRDAPPGRLELSDLGMNSLELNTLESRRQACGIIITAIKHRNQDERQEIANQVAQRAACNLPTDLMLSSEQVRLMHSAGMEIGAHTLTHPILAKTTPEKAWEEISGGKSALEGIIDDEIRLFAYPNGKPGVDYLPEHVTMVEKAGYSAAVSTQWGVSSPQTGRYELRRFTPWDRGQAMFLLRLLKNYIHAD